MVLTKRSVNLLLVKHSELSYWCLQSRGSYQRTSSLRYCEVKTSSGRPKILTDETAYLRGRKAKQKPGYDHKGAAGRHSWHKSSGALFTVQNRVIKRKRTCKPHHKSLQGNVWKRQLIQKQVDRSLATITKVLHMKVAQWEKGIHWISACPKQILHEFRSVDNVVIIHSWLRDARESESWNMSETLKTSNMWLLVAAAHSPPAWPQNHLQTQRKCRLQSRSYSSRPQPSTTQYTDQMEIIYNEYE